MENIKIFCFNNSLVPNDPHLKFQETFQTSHHAVTGTYHTNKQQSEIIVNFTTGQLTNIALSNHHISGVFKNGDHIFGLRDKDHKVWVAVENKFQTIYYNTNYRKKLNYEDCSDVIDHEIKKRKGKWHLTAVQWLDYDDISQILRVHIYKKFHLWDQSRSIEPWLNVIISNQISNLLRNNYGNYSRPCLQCSANEGADLCSIYGTQCNACPLFHKWSKTKKRAYDSKLPLPLENHLQEVHDKPNVNVNIQRGIENLDKYMKKTLKPIEYKVFKYLYIKGGSEENLAKVLKFKTTEKGRAAGYRQIKNLKDSIFVKVNQAIYQLKIDF